MLKKYMFMYNFFFNYPTPSNLTYLWNFGVLSFFFFVMQFVTGFFLSMYYFPYDQTAFVSVENIMREVEYGWLISYVHSNGASFFFLFVFAHIFRNLFYWSFISPSYNMWNTGVLMFLLMIVTAFTGYVLPWGQMSFWAATVITNLFSAIPFFGDFVMVWLWGSFSVSGMTLNSFFSMHFMLPIVMFVLILVHFLFLHEVGSSNSLSMSKTCDKIEFHPYYTFKDFFVVFMIFVFFFVFMGFMPNHLSHPDNYMPADPLTTPAHMVPEWYFLLFYAMLRSVPSKLGGVIMLFASMLMLFIFPHFMKLFFFNDVWKNEKYEMYNESKLNYLSNDLNFMAWKKNLFFYDFSKMLFLFFVITFMTLSVLGSKPMEMPYLLMGSMFTLFYFFYFFFNIYYFYVLSSMNYLIYQINYVKISYNNMKIKILNFTFKMNQFLPKNSFKKSALDNLSALLKKIT